MHRARVVRQIAALAAAFVLPLALASCSGRRPLVSSIRWTDESGAALPFRDLSARQSGAEGFLSAAAPADRFALDRPRPVGAGEALELELLRGEGAGTPQVRIVLGGGSGNRALRLEESIVLRDDHTYYVIPLESGRPLSSVEIGLAPPGGGAGGEGALPSASSSTAPIASLRSLSFRPGFRGFERLPQALRISSGFSLFLQNGKQHAQIESPFTGMDAPDQKDRGAPILLLDYGPCPSATVFELAPASAASGLLRLRPRHEGLRTALGEGLFAAQASRLDLVLPLGVELRSFYTSNMAGGDAELADLGRVLLSRRADSASDFDFYRWDRFPDVLVFDFKDYATQDLYLKRIAFYIEKAGFRGRLASDAEIADLHGWNAHDYRPEDLAAFFQAAAAKSFPLNAEEKALRAILVQRGLIVEQGGRVVPGTGAFISISRESPSYLRTQLLVHESTHAIFFVDPEYRKFVRSLWASIGQDERWFWNLYFNWSGYDTGSEYLMANEFQAYLLQQPVGRAEEYFSKTQTEQILKKHPEYQANIDAYMQKFSKRYADRAATIEAWIKKKYGLEAGRTYSLY